MNINKSKLWLEIALSFALIAFAYATYAACDCPKVEYISAEVICDQGQGIAECWRYEFSPYKSFCNTAEPNSCLECFTDTTETTIAVNVYFGSGANCTECEASMVPAGTGTTTNHQAWNDDTMCGGNS